MVKVAIDPGAGFCFGVEQVIQTAESHLNRGEILYGLGEMVHNSQEVKRLNDLGLKTINHKALSGLKQGKVLFRAHGEPPSTYKLAAEYRLEIIDGTCPIVSRLQERIRRTYNNMDHLKEQLVIFGKLDHPETIGLLGQVDGDAVVVSSAEEVALVDSSRAVHLFSQTTMDPEQFKEVEGRLKNHLAEPVKSTLQSSCTICGQMKKRKPGLRIFSAKHDVIIFVSGKNSSNGKMLYGYCRSINPRTHWISKGDEIPSEWFADADSVGISGATSTSLEQLKSISDQVKKIIKK
ncbi:MAG: 4-hydroxy-3-methylbut-2-enyl diphosphate reductase [Bacteroidota bacterium]